VVVEPHYQRINHFSPEGRLVAQWGIKGTNAGEFILPRSIAQNSLGEFFVSEYTLVDRVQRFAIGPATSLPPSSIRVPIRTGDGKRDLEARVTAGWGTPGLGPGQFNRAEGIGLDRSNRVYVADSCNHRIQVFDPGGKFLRTYGKAGSNPGEFSYPYDIKVDRHGNQFVCEFGNSRITVLDAQDQVIEVLGHAGGGAGEFANPWSIALDSKGNLYVADSQNHRVQKFTRRGSVGGVAADVSPWQWSGHPSGRAVRHSEISPPPQPPTGIDSHGEGGDRIQPVTADVSSRHGPRPTLASGVHLHRLTSAATSPRPYARVSPRRSLSTAHVGTYGGSRVR
jgi:hypothetical protein